MLIARVVADDTLTPNIKELATYVVELFESEFNPNESFWNKLDELINYYKKD